MTPTVRGGLWTWRGRGGPDTLPLAIPPTREGPARVGTSAQGSRRTARAPGVRSGHACHSLRGPHVRRAASVCVNVADTTCGEEGGGRREERPSPLRPIPHCGLPDSGATPSSPWDGGPPCVSRVRRPRHVRVFTSSHVDCTGPARGAGHTRLPLTGTLPPTPVDSCCPPLAAPWSGQTWRCPRSPRSAFSLHALERQERARGKVPSPSHTATLWFAGRRRNAQAGSEVLHPMGGRSRATVRQPTVWYGPQRGGPLLPPPSSPQVSATLTHTEALRAYGPRREWHACPERTPGARAARLEPCAEVPTRAGPSLVGGTARGRVSIRPSPAPPRPQPAPHSGCHRGT
jgi:hypothetical protein